MGLSFTDIFCGAGGSSIGLAAAGYELRLAANHWQRAIETHAANFPDAEHVCADINNYDMRRLPSTDVLWASPICTEISPAGGRRRRPKVAGQLEMLEEYGHLDRAAFDRTRATAQDVIRATEVHRYPVVLCENVPEFAEWELFGWWLDGMRILGYQHQIVCVSSAHIGSPANPWAPQWRDRLYIVFTRTGIPLPDVEPRPLAWCTECGRDVHARQWWKNPRRAKVGRYRAQYLYRCP
jgi:DNA (cytosine-5)-methyltransferase 1